MKKLGVTKLKNIEHDGSITIATGRSRKETEWKNREMLWSDLTERLSKTQRTAETYDEYRKSTKAEQDRIKDVGGFVGGTIKTGRRRLSNISWRQVITLDADYVKGDFWATIEMLFDNACCIYSTHSHTPESPRIRLVIPLTRPVTPDEYQAVSRKIAEAIGIDFFDDTTYEPHRLMYWPSTAQDAEFIFDLQDAPWLNPDDILAMYEDWTDPALWPESSRVHESRERMADRQGDPYEKPGMVGAFCRTYSIQDAIETYLKDVYKQEDDGRYTYIPGSTSGGLVLYEDGKFAYSHHGTDPVSGLLVNSFDLVRIHKFGIRDEEAKEDTPINRLPSFKVMTDFANKDKRVTQQLGEESLKQAEVDFEKYEEDDLTWLQELDRKKNGTIESSRPNILTILEHDPQLKGNIAYDEFAHRPIIRGDLPWENAEEGDYWHDHDEMALMHYLESVYGVDSVGKVRDAVGVLMKRHRYHPVKEYLKGLEWDGKKRIETLLIDYLGAEDTDYVRAITRKALTAAIARIYEPGCKFDYMLTLSGPQGIGKSLMLNKLGKEWFSDSLSTVTGKEAYEQLQGSWIIEMGELTATRKADIEATKHFLSKQEDIFRVAYGRQVSIFPRQCIFIGTTNEREFLRDRTGNRRFWTVDVGVNENKYTVQEDLTSYVVDQMWAEAKANYEKGEKLYLTGKLEDDARAMQDRHTEEDPLTGMIKEYLDKKLPSDWDQFDLGQRRMYLGSEFEGAQGVEKRSRVCAIEIWCELLNGDVKNFKPIEARKINDILRNLPDWKPHNSTMRFGEIYGVQRGYIRKENM